MEKPEVSANNEFEKAEGDAEKNLQHGFEAETLDEKNEDTEKHLVFTILGRLYALPSRLISEIAIPDAVYPLPLLPAYVPGVINRYSIPYALFDIGLLLFKTPSPRNKVLVMKDDIDRIAFLIDDVNGIADISQEMLITVDKSAESNDLSEAISGAFSWEGNDVFVLDVHYVLARASDEAV
ncbi:MAG: chemotaxis protein CheW [Spirochaetaceae bacterium]|nr:chemotaxis protein CheW [Spirochaetaceae bacterium]